MREGDLARFRVENVYLRDETVKRLMSECCKAALGILYLDRFEERAKAHNAMVEKDP